MAKSSDIKKAAPSKKGVKRGPYKKAAKKKTGRPKGSTAYDGDDTDKIVSKLCKLGATDKDICEALGIGERTLNDWKKIHDSFSQALKEGKDAFNNGLVENALLKRAQGFEYEEKDMLPDGKTITKKRYEAPNPTALIFWLKNRDTKRWRDKIEQEHTGQVKITFDKQDEGV